MKTHYTIKYSKKMNLWYGYAGKSLIAKNAILQAVLDMIKSHAIYDRSAS